MSQSNAYLDSVAHPLVAIVNGVDKDVERGEDMLMLGYSLVLMAPIFAPIAPPRILLPLMALAFAISVCRARLNFLGIRASGRRHRGIGRPARLVFAATYQRNFDRTPQDHADRGFQSLKEFAANGQEHFGSYADQPAMEADFLHAGIANCRGKTAGFIKPGRDRR